jgi:malonate decarboxylase beta subunit
VIEQEAGIEELDSSDRRHVWQLIGGEQRALTGFADALVEDDPDAVRAAVQRAFELGVPAAHRSEQVDTYLARLAEVDPANVTPETMRTVFHANTAIQSSKEEA